MNRIHQMTAKAIATPQHPVLVTANSDADEALRRVQGRPAPIRPPSAALHYLPTGISHSGKSRPLPTEPGARRRALNIRGW